MFVLCTLSTRVVDQVGAAGSPPKNASSQTRVTADTTTNSFYGSGASVASYYFQVCENHDLDYLSLPSA